MKVNGIDPTDLSNPLVKKISDLKFQTGTSVLLGEYRNAIRASKELAEIGVDNFELVANVPNRVTGTFSIFSKMGLRAVFYSIINKFRPKTPAEKRFGELCWMLKKGLIKV